MTPDTGRSGRWILPVERPVCRESTVLGAEYLAGMALGAWSHTDEITILRAVDQIYEPKMAQSERTRLFSNWQRALVRAQSWAGV